MYSVGFFVNVPWWGKIIHADLTVLASNAKVVIFSCFPNATIRKTCARRTNPGYSYVRDCRHSVWEYVRNRTDGRVSRLIISSNNNFCTNFCIEFFFITTTIVINIHYACTSQKNRACVLVKRQNIVKTVCISRTSTSSETSDTRFISRVFFFK